ncbi:MAG: hypothetical protein ABID54_13335 [Pseudomonadota bacterium]
MSKKEKTIRITPVKAFLEELMCPLCKVPMVATGKMLTSNPPSYPHICMKCGKRMNVNKLYPSVRHRPKGKSIDLNG